MNRIDAITGFVVAAFSLAGLIYFVPRETFSLGDDFGLSPAFFPYFVLGLLFGLSALLAIINIYRPAEDDRHIIFERHTFRKFILSCILAFGSIIGLYYFGFLIVAPLVIATAMLLMGCRKWLQVAAVSLLSSFTLYGVFALILSLPLPKGLFFS